MRVTASLRRADWGLGRIAGFAACCVMTCLPGGPAQAISPEAFLQLPAIQAFKEGRYQDAIDGLRQIPIAGPDDAIVLRYIALAYQQLGDHAQAVAVIEEGLAVAPDNAALLYFRAVSLLELSRPENALRDLERVVALAPDSVYAQQSQQILGSLRALVGTGAAPAEEQDWSLRLEAGTQYDTNIPAAPDGFGTPTGGWRVFERATGSAEVWSTGAWSASVDGDLYGSQHFDSEFRDFDTILAKAGGGLRHITSIGDVPLSLDAAYHFEAIWVGGEPFSWSHELTAGTVAALTDDLLTQLQYTATFEEFDDDGVLPAVTSRDAVAHDFGLTQYWFVDGRDNYLYASYAYGFTVADGSNFDRRSHTATAGGSALVGGEVRLDAEFTYLHEDYPDFIGPIQRETDRFDLTLGASKEIFDDTELTASWTYVDEQSSINVLEYDQHVGTVSIVYSF
jgi:tetratricopeptide (TPR) repeat protein